MENFSSLGRKVLHPYDGNFSIPRIESFSSQEWKFSVATAQQWDRKMKKWETKPRKRKSSIFLFYTLKIQYFFLLTLKKEKTKQIMKGSICVPETTWKIKKKVLVLLYVALKKAKKFKHKWFSFLAFYPFFCENVGR